MNNYIELSDYELDLISTGLWIMMIKKANNSIERGENDAKKYHEALSLEVFTLCLKVKSFDDKYIDFSLRELKLIEKSLGFLATFSYQKSLEEKDKTQYYENCNLEFIKIRKKINNMESYAIHGDDENTMIHQSLLS